MNQTIQIRLIRFICVLNPEEARNNLDECNIELHQIYKLLKPLVDFILF